MTQPLDNLIAERDKYDKESQAVIDNLSFARSELADLTAMKQTEGWKLLDKKIREELQNRIKNLVKDDLQIQTLLALLQVADTKSIAKMLEEAVEGFLPN